MHKRNISSSSSFFFGFAMNWPTVESRDQHRRPQYQPKNVQPMYLKRNATHRSGRSVGRLVHTDHLGPTMGAARNATCCAATSVLIGRQEVGSCNSISILILISIGSCSLLLARASQLDYKLSLYLPEYPNPYRALVFLSLSRFLSLQSVVCDVPNNRLASNVTGIGLMLELAVLTMPIQRAEEGYRRHLRAGLALQSAALGANTLSHRRATVVSCLRSNCLG